MPGPKPSGTPRRKPFGVALHPHFIQELDTLIETLIRIEAEFPERGVSLPTTRSSLGAYLIEEGLATARRALLGISRHQDGTLTEEDISIVNNSSLWHRVLHYYPRNRPFPPPVPPPEPHDSPTGEDSRPQSPEVPS